jgi:hypothetical protein
MDAVKASNKPNATDKSGGFHEEGGIWGKDTQGMTRVSPALPGRTWMNDGTGIDINVLIAVNQDLTDEMISAKSILGKYHVHPRGGDILTPQGWRPAKVQQEPSQGDFKNANYGTNIVAGAKSKQIYFYDNNDTLGSMSFRNFMKGCP